jgi:hypothetical protein
MSFFTSTDQQEEWKIHVFQTQCSFVRCELEPDVWNSVPKIPERFLRSERHPWFQTVARLR